MNIFASFFDKILSSTNFSGGLKIILSVIFILVTIHYCNPFFIRFELLINYAVPLSIALGIGMAICVTEVIMKILNFIGFFIKDKYQNYSENADIKSQKKEANKEIKNNFIETFHHLTPLQINYLEKLSKCSLTIDENQINNDQHEAILYLDVNGFIFTNSSISSSKNIYCLNPSLQKLLNKHLFKMRTENVDKFLDRKSEFNKNIISFFSASKDTGNFQISDAVLSELNPLHYCFEYSSNNRLSTISFREGYKDIFEKKLRTKLLNKINFKAV